MNRIDLYNMDCRDAMSLFLPDNSVDAIVCDPPYGLEFMGKKWDYDVPGVDIWAECLRVLKPGGHLLAFAGTRTQHRMAVRIEDAGFEIRDMIMWTYASGFPKSHNLDNLRGDKICGCSEPYTQSGAQEIPECNVRPVREPDVSAPLNTCTKPSEILQPRMQEQGASAAGRAQLSAAKDGCEQSGMEGWRDASQATGELCAGAVHQSPSVGGAYGPQGRLRDGAPADDGGMVRLPADAGGSGTPRGPQPVAQRAQKPGAVAGQSKPQAVGAWPVCGGCGLPVVPRGLGTALKPALEPITMARKPLIGTVAANVLAHGTGGLNIDGCRVATDENLNGGAYAKTATEREQMWGAEAGNSWVRGGAGDFKQPEGRWPANLIHDGSSDVVAAFPQAKGQQGALTGSEPSSKTANTFGEFVGRTPSEPRGDTGSAARFFYCAKASKSDRGAENNHPTVKPTDLMAYLCRLVTPPGGVVLDPFMGSGSTGKAALREGFGFIGCEMDAAYFAIAQARLAAVKVAA